MKFKTILSSLILAIAVIIAQKLNYMVEAKVSTTYNATYQFVCCSIIMMVLGIVVGLNVIWILEASSYIDTIVAIVLQIVAAVVGFEVFQTITFLPFMIIGVYVCILTLQLIKKSK